MLDAKREKFKNIEKLVAKIFSFFPFTPNQYTAATILFALLSFFFLFKKKILIAILFFLLASFLDFVDGAVARYKKKATKIGAYFDTIADRFVEGILLLGILFLELPDVIFKSYIWIFLILFGSLMTTYAKAAAKEKDLVVEELKGGILARGERLFLILFSLILSLFNPYFCVCLLIIIAILTNFTAVQRICFAVKKSKK
jgi:phosphatidylglycerophosphate synthase